MIKLRNKEGKTLQMYQEVQNIPLPKEKEYKQINLHVGGFELDSNPTELDAINKAIVDYKQQGIIDPSLVSDGISTFLELRNVIIEKQKIIENLKTLLQNYEQTK